MQAGFSTVEVDGRRLETRWIAPAADGLPPIVMLHEGLGSIALWKDFPDRLAARTGAGVLVYSRYGYGRSDPLVGKRDVDYMHHEARVALPALLQALGLQRPVLFGHSDGASIALLHAAAYPDGPAAIVLEAPHVFVEDLTIDSIVEAKHSFETTDLGLKLGRFHADAANAFWGWNDIWLDPRFRAWNIEAMLPAIRCPVLVLQGADDEYGTPAQLDAIARAVPQAQTVLLPDCRHSPHRDQPEAVLDRTAAFLTA